MSVFALTGSISLVFFLVAGGIAVVIGLVLREAVGRMPGGAASEATITALDPYEAAYLRDGARAAITTAIATLVHRGQPRIRAGSCHPGPPGLR